MFGSGRDCHNRIGGHRLPYRLADDPVDGTQGSVPIRPGVDSTSVPLEQWEDFIKGRQQRRRKSRKEPDKGEPAPGREGLIDEYAESPRFDRSASFGSKIPAESTRSAPSDIRHLSLAVRGSGHRPFVGGSHRGIA
jgi:hypothetical protein